VANALRRRTPGRSILWVAEPAPAQVVEHHPAADHIVVFRRREGARGIRRLREDMARHPCQLTLNLQFHLKSAFPTLFSGATVRIGFDRKKARDGLSLLHTHSLPPGPWRHTQDLFLEFLDFLGVPRNTLEWGIAISAEERQRQGAFFSTLSSRPVAGIILATRNPRKDWPRERYVPLVEALEDDFGYQPLLLGGPGSREREAADFILSEARTRPIHALGDSVRELIWKLDGCDLVISPDTGPLHIAHALHIPVIGLFGHTNPWRVGPYCWFHDLLIDRYTNPGEDPSPERYAPRQGGMEQITLADVLDRVEAAGNRYGTRRRKELAGA
jgi:heptosyltransferase I